MICPAFKWLGHKVLPRYFIPSFHHSVIIYFPIKISTVVAHTQIRYIDISYEYIGGVRIRWFLTKLCLLNFEKKSEILSFRSLTFSICRLFTKKHRSISSDEFDRVMPLELTRKIRSFRSLTFEVHDAYYVYIPF